MSPDGREASPGPSARSYQHPPGGHLLLTYRGEEPPFRPVVSFLTAGLADNRRLLYLYSQASPPEVKEHLREANLDVDGLLASGQLHFQAAEKHYLNGETLDPDRLVGKLRAALKEAIRDGYDGLYVVGEACRAPEQGELAVSLVEYERRVRDLLAEEAVDALCLYPADQFNDPLLDAMSEVHGEHLHQPEADGKDLKRIRAPNGASAEELSRETSFRALPEALLHVRWPEGLIQACNPAAEEFTGYDRGDLIGSLLDRLFADDKDADAFRRRLTSALDQEYPTRISFPIERADGEIHPTEHVLTPLAEISPDQPGPALLLMREVSESEAS